LAVNLIVGQMEILKRIGQSYQDYAGYLWSDITHPNWHSFFWWTIGLSVFFFGLEVLRPWRKVQPILRKDFWLDLFYIAFNFFIFSLIGWFALQQVVLAGLSQLFAWVGYEQGLAKAVASLPVWAYYPLLFVVADFISWNVHRLLHRVPWLWEFHKVHHSVEQMGFAAHVRYHWMENVVYWIFRFLPLTLLGFDLVDIFWVHILNVAWGHFNHANITVSPRWSGAIFGALAGLGIGVTLTDSWWQWGLALLGGTVVGLLLLGPYMRYLFNSPEMHLWHHAYDVPAGHRYGVNFGITLAIWDYVWRSAYVPRHDAEIRLGFQGIEGYPKSFWRQLLSGFRRG
jgi:sterol desaturase/sphingolipid hydroxylase (fatty acid hydroxylase superfamily)